MRRKLLFFAVVASLALTGCTKPAPEPELPTKPELELSVSTKELQFDFDEVWVDKTAKVTTNAESFEISVAYDDTQNEGWIDAVKDGENIKVAVIERHLDPAEQPRTATITVTAGELSEAIKVTQLSFVETDFSIALSAETLDFAASGNYLTKEVTATSKITPLTPATEADWITSLSIEGDIIKVIVSENDGDDRIAVVAVTNERGGSTTFTVNQYGKPSVDIAGTWTWNSLSATSNTLDGWAAAQQMSGEAVVELIDGGYAVKGIKGIGVEMAIILADNPDLMPEMHIRLEDGQLFVGINSQTSTEQGLNIPLDPAFSVGEKNYYSAKSLHYGDMDTPIYTGLDFPITMLTEENDGVIYEKLIFPTEYSTNPEMEGRTGEVTYIYYSYVYNPRTGIRYSPADSHRNIVLTRPIE